MEGNPLMDDQVLLMIDEKLRNHLKPVTPHPELVQRVQKRLFVPQDIFVEAHPFISRAFVAIGLGLLAGAVFILGLRRIFKRK